MEKFICSIALCCVAIGSLLAQSNARLEKNQLKINIINPGLEYEVRIGKNQTFDFGAGLQFTGASTGSEFFYAFLPAFNAQYRYYYNIGRRLEKNKSISGNSGNYIAGSGTLFTSDVIIGNATSGSGFAGFVGPIYGIQRTYRSGFNFSMEFGLGVYFAGDSNLRAVSTGIGPTISFSIGWVLRKGK